MKVVKGWVVTKLARQVEGDYCFFNIEKASTRLSAIDEYVNNNPISPTEVIQTDVGSIPCMCERGIIEIDIEIDEDSLTN